MKVLIFGGTAEGRHEALKRESAGDTVLCSVTTEYARELLPDSMPCLVGKMDAEQMRRAFEEFSPDLVIDATHPFAVSASANILSAAKSKGLPLIRVSRPEDARENWHDAVTWADSAEEAAEHLTGTQGNILLTTGSNTLSEYLKHLPRERVWARVLPTARVMDLCAEAGLAPAHIIAMQGPFTEEFNLALYRMLNIAHLVTKDSGQAGGTHEKVLAALEENIAVVVIRRPKEEGTCAENA